MSSACCQAPGICWQAFGSVLTSAHHGSSDGARECRFPSPPAWLTPSIRRTSTYSSYTGDYNGDGRTDLFVYNPGNGTNYVELANGNGTWSGSKGPYFSPGWQVYPGVFN
jgi:hypothetical protein